MDAVLSSVDSSPCSSPSSVSTSMNEGPLGVSVAPTTCTGAAGGPDSLPGASVAHSTALETASPSGFCSASTVQVSVTPGSSSSSTRPMGLLELTSTPSRKRTRSLDKWQKMKRKNLRNTGQEYVSTAKKNVSV